MRAIAVTPGQRDSGRLIDAPDPGPGPGEALVRVVRAGVCGTDAEINAGLYGEAPPGVNYLILGHENLGRVEALPDDAAARNGLAVGDLVVSTVRRPDDCPNCRAGESDMCLTGHYRERGIKGLPGYWAERYAESPAFMVRLPPELEAVGVLLEPLSVMEKAVAQASAIQRRMVWEPKTAIVLGAGPIGQLGTLLLRLQGLRVATVATRPRGGLKSQIVEACGAEYVSVREEPLQRLAQRLGNVDLVIEATGVGSLAFEAMGVVGINGVVALTSVSGGSAQVNVPADKLNLAFVLGNKALFGSVNANRRYFESGVAHLAQFRQRWPGLLDRLITRRLPLERFHEAFEEGREEIKTVIEIGGAA